MKTWNEFCLNLGFKDWMKHEWNVVNGKTKLNLSPNGQVNFLTKIMRHHMCTVKNLNTKMSKLLFFTLKLVDFISQLFLRCSNHILLLSDVFHL